MNLPVIFGLVFFLALTQAASRCSLSRDSGPCRAYIPRFYFNAGTNSCEQFIYGGCVGNENNFKSLPECRAACSNSANLKSQQENNPVPIGNELSITECSLPARPGPCMAYIPRFYFNAKAGSCQKFIYGGCQGNRNNFESQSECEGICSYSVKSQQENNPAPTGNELSTASRCSLSRDSGPCRAYIPRFYFNARSGACEKFIYGGCVGNQNNFKSLLECRSECSSSMQSEKVEGVENWNCPPMCLMYCQHGYVKDVHGCDTCQCVQPPQASSVTPENEEVVKKDYSNCPPVCLIYCQFGNATDAHGCPKCECLPPPQKASVTLGLGLVLLGIGGGAYWMLRKKDAENHEYDQLLVQQEV